MTTVNKTAGGRKSPQSAASTNAAYKAPSSGTDTCARTDFALLSLKGVMVKAAIRGGDLLEGIFDALDHDKRTISLKLVRRFSPPSSSSSSSSSVEEGGQEEGTTSFALSELICLTSEPVNFAEATGGHAFATDAEISGSAGPLRERQLARWEGGTDEGEAAALVGSLEEEAGPPGVGWDQFDANKRLFGVETSFDEAQYTTIIDRNSEEYRRLEREAERLAAEITGEANAPITGNINEMHLAEERGLQVDDSQMDEEDRYGAVVRPSSTGGTREPIMSKSPPASFREAALSGSSASVVTMPKSITSASPSAAAKSGQSSGQPASSTVSESEMGVSAVPLPASARPRKSIAHLHVDPTALEQARESVNQATDAIQRRMSQVQVETGKEEPERKPSLNPHAADFIPGAPLPSSNMGVASLSESVVVNNAPIGMTSTSSASGGASKTTTFNPNAAAYVPSSYGPSLVPAYGYNPLYYAPNAYQQPPYVGGGGVPGAGYYNQGPYYNPYQYYRYHHSNQGTHSQQHYQQSPSRSLEPPQSHSQSKDGIVTSASSSPQSTSLDL